jgi:hypothetical protein
MERIRGLYKKQSFERSLISRGKDTIQKEKKMPELSRCCKNISKGFKELPIIAGTPECTG